LLGKWIKTAEIDDDNPTYFPIEKEDLAHYRIEKFEYSNTEKSYSSDLYKAHLSPVEDYLFLNMQLEDNDAFYLYRIDLKDDRFVLYEVTDNIDEQFETSAELFAFVQKNMRLSFFYNQDEETYLLEKE
jgi:hypothetical protein